MERTQTGQTEFVDCRNQTHRVIHSLLKGQETDRERREQLAQELYRILTVHRE